MRLEDAVVNAQARAGYALADGGALVILAGPVTLARLGFGRPAFGVPAGGVIRALPLTSEMAAPATGDADGYEVHAADGALLWSGTVGLVGSGADMEMASVSIQRGSVVEITSGPVMTVPKTQEGRA